MSVRALRRGTMAGRGAAPAITNVLSLPGASGEYVSTPDTPGNSITGDIDIRMWLALDSWVTDYWLLSRWGVFASGQLGWSFAMLGGGALQLNVSDDGTSGGSSQSSVATGFTAGSAHWIRCTWRTSDGRLQFFTSEDGAAWTQLGSNATLSKTGIFDTNAAVEIGSALGGTVLPVAGKIYYAEFRNGIGGTIVHSFDATAVTKIGTRNPSTVSAGGPWTINGSAWDWAAP